MAAYTRSKLAAVNEILETVNEDRVSALDSTGSWPALTYGSTVAGAAEFVLDRALEFELSRGWHFNTVYNKSYTGTSITFGSTVLRAIPTGPSRFLPIGIRSGLGYDLTTDSATFTSGTYYFDIVTIHEFSTIPMDIQNIIVKRAKRDFNREKKGNPAKDALLLDEYVQAESLGQRPLIPLYPVAMNQQNIPARSLAGGGQQQQ